jgi:hypothetical protein
LPLDIALSASGTVLSQLLTDSRKVTGIDPASPVIWSDNSTLSSSSLSPAWPSPDGTLLAAAGHRGQKDSKTSIISNGALSATIPGWGAGWLDNNRLLVNTYGGMPDQTGEYTYQGASIYDAAGHQLATLAIPEVGDLQVVTSDSIYSTNAIVSVASGETIWSSGDIPTGGGAIAGGYVVFPVGNRVVALMH